MRQRIFSGIVLTLCVSAAARAGLIGATVKVTTNYPTQTEIYEDRGSRIVSTAVEYPTGTFFIYNPVWQVDISDSQFVLSWTAASDSFFWPATFNGFVLNVLSGPTITAATTDTASTLIPASIALIGGNQLFLNYSDVVVPANGVSIIDINTVPIPAALWLLGSALGVLGYLRRRVLSN